MKRKLKPSKAVQILKKRKCSKMIEPFQDEKISKSMMKFFYTSSSIALAWAIGIVIVAIL